MVIGQAKKKAKVTGSLRAEKRKIIIQDNVQSRKKRDGGCRERTEGTGWRREGSKSQRRETIDPPRLSFIINLII